MANAGFNAATDIFSLGSAWKVKSSTINKSASTAECADGNGDVTHRDAYGERIAPTAEYELAADVTTLPALGTVVTVGSDKVAIASLTVKTSKGAPVTLSVAGVQVNADAATKRSYAVGTISIKARHKAQDILSLHTTALPSTCTDATFTFTADVTVSEPQGAIANFDVSNGKVVASYTHAVADGSTISAPTVSGTDAVVSQPVTTASPENDYTTTDYAVTKSLTGAEAA